MNCQLSTINYQLYADGWIHRLQKKQPLVMMFKD